MRTFEDFTFGTPLVLFCDRCRTMDTFGPGMTMQAVVKHVGIHVTMCPARPIPDAADALADARTRDLLQGEAAGGLDLSAEAQPDLRTLVYTQFRQEARKAINLLRHNGPVLTTVEQLIHMERALEAVEVVDGVL